MLESRDFLLFSYIAPFLCWAFDVTTTLYAIDYLGVAGETNPLGWPLGALGALLFYIPAFIFTRLLLFKIQDRHSLWAGVMITGLAHVLGFMNLLAGWHNLKVAELYTGTLIPFPKFEFDTIYGQAFFGITVCIIFLAVLGIKAMATRFFRNLKF